MDIARALVDALEEKKAENIVLMDLHGVVSFTDYFIICSGTSDRMLDSLADVVQTTAKRDFKLSSKLEGRSSDGWLLVDFGDIIVHLFYPEQREYYQIEQLWNQSKVLLRVQ